MLHYRFSPVIVCFELWPQIHMYLLCIHGWWICTHIHLSKSVLSFARKVFISGHVNWEAIAMQFFHMVEHIVVHHFYIFLHHLARFVIAMGPLSKRISASCCRCFTLSFSGIGIILKSERTLKDQILPKVQVPVPGNLISISKTPSQLPELRLRPVCARSSANGRRAR